MVTTTSARKSYRTTNAIIVIVIIIIIYCTGTGRNAIDSPAKIFRPTAEHGRRYDVCESHESRGICISVFYHHHVCRVSRPLQFFYSTFDDDIIVSRIYVGIMNT